MMSSPAPPPPPLPPPEEDYNQELTYDDNEDDAYDAISFNFSDSDKNATPASLSHTRQSNKSHDIYQFNDHTSTEQSKAIITSRTNGEQMPPSPMSTQSPIKSPATSILLDIDLGDGSKGAINVTAMCNPIVSKSRSKILCMFTFALCLALFRSWPMSLYMHMDSIQIIWTRWLTILPEQWYYPI